MAAWSHYKTSRKQILNQLGEDFLSYRGRMSHNPHWKNVKNGSWTAERKHLKII